MDGGSALTQKNFSDRLGKVVYDDRHPLITGLMTGVGNTFLSGWSRAGVEHIVTIYGFDFTSPTEGKIYYMETDNLPGDTNTTAGPKEMDYQSFWTLVAENDVQIAAPKA